MPQFEPPTDAMAEQDCALREFMHLLASIKGDGGGKRARGLKPHWTVDPSHKAAIFSHLAKWQRGELQDESTGAHPLIHLAWRALAIAWAESHSVVSIGLTNGEKPLDAVAVPVAKGAIVIGKIAS